jgi:hypothetical protein
MDNPDGADGAQARLSDSVRRVKDAAETVLERGKEKTGEAIAQGAERAGAAADTTAAALKRAAADIEGDNQLIGSALRKGAEAIERAAQSIQGGDLSRTVADLNGFARRQPALFLGASLALGFALARVGKTAIEQTASDHAAAPAEPTFAGS